MSYCQIYKVIRMRGQGSLERQNFTPEHDFKQIFGKLTELNIYFGLIVFPGKIMKLFFGKT